MENTGFIERLNHYNYEDNILFTGFKSFDDAEVLAGKRNGKLVEVGFLDGNDNPVLADNAHLIANHRYFLAVSTHPDYTIVHSNDKGFQELLDAWLKRTQEVQEKSLEEQYISDSDNLIPEDGVFILHNGEIEKATSRERVRYFHHISVYELGVMIPKD